MARTKTPHVAKLRTVQANLYLSDLPHLEATDETGRTIYISFVSTYGNPSFAGTVDRIRQLADNLTNLADRLENSDDISGRKMRQAFDRMSARI